MPSLSHALHALSTEDGCSVIDAPSAWSQGRTLYGGMTAALCHEAARRQLGIDAPLRSAHFLFAGPATGMLGFAPQILRAGRSSTAVAVECTTADTLAARAAFVFGADRDSIIHSAACRADCFPAPEECVAFIGPTGGFHDNFEFRLAGGSALCSGGAPRFTVWARFRDPPHVDPITALLAMADALAPAAMAAFPAPAPISTMTWTLDIAHVPATMDGWHLLASDSEHSQGGYSMQAMSLWDAGGRRLASGRQMVAIFV